jgi:homoserine/homoserine lactone efflux protein
MTLDTYLTFCVAGLAFALVPGPSVTVIIANSLRYGSRVGLLTVLGTQLGLAVWLLVAAFGLTAMIKLLGVWFDVLRIVGALYLVWLGVKMFLSKGNLGQGKAQERKPRGFLLQGFTVIMSNPKILVLFGAIIPPFLTPGGNAMRETIMLGLTFMVIATIGDSSYALLAGKAGAWLTRSRVRVIEIISGICLTMGGLWMVLRGH